MYFGINHTKETRFQPGVTDFVAALKEVEREWGVVLCLKVMAADWKGAQPDDLVLAVDLVHEIHRQELHFPPPAVTAWSLDAVHTFASLALMLVYDWSSEMQRHIRA